MTKTTTHATATAPALRWTLIITMALLAFFATYQFAIARTSVAPAAAAVAEAPAELAPTSGSPAQDPGTSAASDAGCACCGSAEAPADAVTSKAAEISGDVQKLTVDASKGYYEPSTIELKAGVPAEITFTQATGCLQEVESADLGFSEDLSGGPKTIKLGALVAGTYGFNCGMQMQFGTIVVK